jgi:hypothetical protein
MMLAVFFPSLMGVGIIVSGMLLLSDWLRRLFPQGRLRRQHAVAVGAYGAIEDALAAAGYSIAKPGFLHRVLRHRYTYLALAAVGVVFAASSVWAGLALHNDPRGVLFGNPWTVGIGSGLGAALAGLATISLVVAVRYRHLPGVLRRLVETTSLGRYTLPSATDQTTVSRTIEKEVSA